MAKKFQFKGKDVDDAVNKACGRFGVERDELDIAIVSTGSTGIFGLLKKQSCIEACLKVDVQETEDTAVEEKAPEPKKAKATKKKSSPRKKTAKKTDTEEASAQPVEVSVATDSSEPKKKSRKPAESPKKARPPYRPVQHEPVPVPEEFHAGLSEELLKILKLMGMSCEISFSEEGGKTKLDIQAEDLIEPLTARDGQALDGLQYLLRKISSQTLPENGMFVVDIDGFRLKRRTELQELAITLSDEVKEKNVTRTIPPLNPSERRIVHMHLQDDTSIRSRSVGSGLFKKILIYKPGTRKRSNRKRSSRSNRSRNNKPEGTQKSVADVRSGSSRNNKGGRREVDGNK